MGSDDDRSHLLGLGTFIRTQRRLAELSQRELAKLTELSDPYVSQLERGLHEPSVRVLRSLSSALGIPVDTLMAKAGWSEASPDENDTNATELAIKNDPALSDEQKASLLTIYQSFVGAADGGA